MSNLQKHYGKQAIKRYNTFYGRLLMLAIDMTEAQQKILLDFAQKVLDKRRKIRNYCLVPTHYNIENKEYTSYILDLNESGAYIETDQYFLSGQYFGLTFVNPFSGRKISTISKIVWSCPDAMGVKFNSLKKVG